MTLREQIVQLQTRERELRQTANERADRIKEQQVQIHDLRARMTERDAEIARLNGILKDRSNAHEGRMIRQKAIVEELKKSHNIMQTELAQAHAENGKLRKSLTAANAREVVEDERAGEDDCDDTSNDGDDGGSSNEGDGDSDEEDDELPDAIHDGLVYCCSECGVEVVDGDCQGCWTKHRWDEEMGKDSVSTQNEALVQDRQLSPRGTTPMREVGKPSIHRDYCASLSGLDRSEEYVELLRRGATRLMCETFHMEFKQATGIVAWADSLLYETFAGPDMQKGDFWKIHLGRRIELDEDDLDGAQFLEDFLEDALLFPLRSDLSNRTHERWETVEESPGIWVTRPMAALEVEVDDDSDDVDDNGSDDDEYDGDSDAHSDAFDKLQIRDYFHQQSNAIRADAYDTDDDEDEQIEAGEADVKAEDENDDSDVQMSDPGWSFNPREADATWPTVLKDDDGDDADVEEDAEGNEGEQPDDGKSETAVNDSSEKDEEEYGNMAVDDFEVSDSADSDFDSDEVLSGDEAIGLKYL